MVELEAGKYVGPQGVLTKQEDVTNYHLGFEHANYWIIYHSIIVEAEGC
jgi:hypothetical protein